jgi:ABC-type branched-subunit amino acid transport system ATPase component
MSGAIIGIAGCLNAFANGTPPPPPFFGVVWSVVFLALAVASGMRHLRSLWMVAAAYTVVPVLLEHHRIPPNLLSGVILLIALILSQSGSKIAGRLKRQFAGGHGDVGDDTMVDDGLGDAIWAPRPHALSASVSGNGRRARSSFVLDSSARVALTGQDLSVLFGGVKAVDEVDFQAEPGQRVAIVGGNGAGKTTLFNALTGYVPLTRGRVSLGGVDVTRRAAHLRARAGIRRTFQIPRLADVLTVSQNIRCGQGGEVGTSSERVDWLVDCFGLTPVKDLPITALPFGYRRKTELVRALARGPRILMMDEPVSGLEDDEVADILDVLLDIQATEGWSLVVIEHDLRFVTGIAECLIVMEEGRVMTSGEVGSVLADDRVRRVYLGDLV